MKTISVLIKTIKKTWEQTFHPAEQGSKEANQPAAIMKAWYTYQKGKERSAEQSNKQLEILYRFMNSHKENDLN